MGSEWKQVRLGELISVKHGYAFKGDDFSESNPEGPIVVTIGNFDYAGGFRFESTRIKRCVSEYPEEYKMQPGEVLLAMTCQTSGGEILGIPGVIPDDGETYLHNQRLGKVVLESNNVDLKYLYWLFLSHGFNHHLFTTATGTKILHTAPKRIESYEFQIPPLPEQKAIAHILGTLDDKIELNRRMNATLEGMAQALFKSWFVDFDPVIDNALAAGNPIPDELAPRAEVRKNAIANGTTQQGSLDHPTLSDPKSLFPAAFHFTEELGWIPEGWEVKQVKDFGSVVCGKTPSKSNADFYGDDVPFIKIPDMHRSAWITETTDGLSFAGANSQAKKQIPAKSISVSCIATVGKVVITSEPSHTNQQINSVIPNAEHSRNYLYFSFHEKNKELHDLASGGSATLNLNTGVFSKIKLLSPPAAALELFHKATNSLFEKMLANDRESQSLTKLRDTLLPKLISGELHLPEAEQLTEEALA